MEIILLIIGFVVGWLVHSVLSFNKFGKELNKLKKEKWENTPSVERVKSRIEALKKNLPKIAEEHLVSMAWSHERDEFPIDEKLYEQAENLTRKEGSVSTAKLMEKLSIGYQRSADIIDELQIRNVVDSNNNLIK